jgi:hypothetical protein
MKRQSAAKLDREIAASIAKRSHSTLARSPYGHELFKTSADKPKPEIIARRRTSDGKSVLLWNDGTLTWGMYDAIKGSPRARTDPQIREALDAGWLVVGEIELYEADEVPRLIEAARKVARRGGSAGDLRSDFAKAAPLKPHWIVQEADRKGRPTVRVWRLSRISHPGVVIWDEVRGSQGSRYRVMTEIMERGRRSGTLADTGVRFKDLTSLSKYLRETSELR